MTLPVLAPSVVHVSSGGILSTGAKLRICGCRQICLQTEDLTAGNFWIHRFPQVEWQRAKKKLWKKIPILEWKICGRYEASSPRKEKFWSCFNKRIYARVNMTSLVFFLSLNWNFYWSIFTQNQMFPDWKWRKYFSDVLLFSRNKYLIITSHACNDNYYFFIYLFCVCM